MSEPAGAQLWHVALTVAGERWTVSEVRGALQRLLVERPFLVLVRCACDEAEVRYWEEAPALTVAVELALLLWPQHRHSAGLPPWSVVGLEVLDRATYLRRRAATPASPPGDLRLL